MSKQAVRAEVTIPSVTLTFDLESDVQVTCDVSHLCANFGLPIGLSVLDLGPMYATDRQTSDSIIA